MHDAVDALLVDGQELELICLGFEGAGGGESDLDFAAFAFVAQGEYVGLGGAGAVETPVVLGDGLGELPLAGSFGLEAIDELAAEAVVRFTVLGGEDGDLAGEAVAQVVHAGACVAVRSSGAG